MERKAANKKAFSGKQSSFYLLSKNFRKKWSNYVWQSALVGIVTAFFLFIINELVALVILAGVGSTFFNVFAMPGARTAQTRNLLGSYIICIAVGVLCFNFTSNVISGGVAVSAAAFFMAVTDTEHPPAAGIALGLSVITTISQLYLGVIFAISGIILAVLLKHMLKPWLKDLY